MTRKTLLLAILDGWGYTRPSPSNAVTVADTPHMDRWMAEYPFTTLTAHNGMVGLPEGQMGNSEVGHLNIGAGRIVYQDYTRINKAIADGELFTNPAICSIMDRVKDGGTSLHFFGLVSDGGVHSHLDHLKALLKMAAERDLNNVYVHCFMDGRDTPPRSGSGYMEELVAAMQEYKCGKVATISGRYWAMDRDTRWDRVEKAWDVLVSGKGVTADDPIQAIEEAYKRGENDEFIKPIVMQENHSPVSKVSDNDGILFFNFRADRARELCRAFTENNFTGFNVSNRPHILDLVTLTEYESDFKLPAAFPPLTLKSILGEVVSKQGLRQLRIAETEKYAHVTYFFNGGEEEPFAGETRVLIHSPRDVDTYDQKPEMSAREVTAKLIEVMEEADSKEKPFDFVVLNFANGDMVGHTGIMEAAVRACETVDECLGKIHAFIRKRNGTMLVTSDHGNAEIMVDPNSAGPYTAHSLSPVPFILVDKNYKDMKLHDGGSLRDIAPTILSLMGLPIPDEMDGSNLLVNE